MIKLTDLLKEEIFDTLLGKELTDEEDIGENSRVYEYKPDPNNKVIKINKSFKKKFPSNLTQDFKLMNNNPDIAAKMYEINHYYVIQEKLDTSKTMKDLWDLRKEIDNNTNWYVFEDMKNYILKGDIDKIISQIKSPKLLNIANKYISLIEKSIKAFGKEVDIHAGNIGYDKQGNLKILDI
jgi:uncharacterized FlaG/YvyC family protein